MNNGGVRIGFSEPYVAIYSHNGNDISYANGQKMARGVSANLTSSSNGSSKFYADNVEAESAAGKFTGGTLALTVDGLALEADKLMARSACRDQSDRRQRHGTGICGQ